MQTIPVKKPGLSTPQAAAFLGVPSGTLRSWRSVRYGPPFFKYRGMVFYRKSDLRVWRNSRRVDPAEASA
jgi:hypothetical protein